MKRRAAFLGTMLALVLLATSSAPAQILFEPPVPASGEPFRILFAGVWRDSCIPTSPRLEVFGRSLVVTFALPADGACLSALSPWSATVELVRLAGGGYSLVTRVEDDSLAPLFDETAFVVTGKEAEVRVYPPFDTTAGHGAVVVTGEPPCFGDCPPPRVLFGALPSPSVRRESSGQIGAVVPPGTGLVDVTIEGPGFTRTGLAAFQYVSRDDWEALLLPVFSEIDVAGQRDTRWRSELALLNQNREPLRVETDLTWVYRDCYVLCGPPDPLWPDDTDTGLGIIARGYAGAPPTALIHVRRAAADHLTGTLRARYVSRQSDGQGCEIPIVRERDLRPSVTLVGVPLDARHRQRLRIYDPVDPAGVVDVEFLNGAGVRLLAVSLTLAWPAGSNGGLNPESWGLTGSTGLPLQPASAALDLSLLPELEVATGVTIRVTARGGEKIWAFASITDNETQQVSIVTPQ
ncbi:MAG: hypothetical protein NDJ92_21160 [Thermoanaerobaculia bacterium]|nr:hypothetical protein [Thermoanaerobaculia bacterium]